MSVDPWMKRMAPSNASNARVRILPGVPGSSEFIVPIGLSSEIPGTVQVDPSLPLEIGPWMFRKGDLLGQGQTGAPQE